MAKEVLSHLTHLGLTDGRGRGRKKEKEKRRKEGDSSRDRSSTLSLDFLVIGQLVFGGARRKVHPRGKSFASRPKSRSFDKLQVISAKKVLF